MNKYNKQLQPIHFAAKQKAEAVTTEMLTNAWKRCVNRLNVA
jgi:hypothetical protein